MPGHGGQPLSTPGAFLTALAPEDADDLRSVGRRVTYGAGVTLVHRGDDAGTVIVLLDGRVKVTAPGGQGREVIIAVRGPGDLLGELSAIDGGPRSATVTTLEPVEALLVPGSAFAALLERRPRIALVLLHLVVARLRYADHQQADLAGHDVAGRVAHRLTELCERFGNRDGQRVELELPLSQEELGDWAGASREAVSKALLQLRSLGILETRRRSITVLDLEALRRRVQ